MRKKTSAELRDLAALGLSLVYVGAESGDDDVLTRVNKGESFATIREALEKLQEAGIKRSVMILNGLGGRELARQHALNSAALMNAAQPEYLATLVVSFPKGEARLRENFPSWEPLCMQGLMQEMELFLSALELKRTIFRREQARRSRARWKKPRTEFQIWFTNQGRADESASAVHGSTPDQARSSGTVCDARREQLLIQKRIRLRHAALLELAPHDAPASADYLSRGVWRRASG